MTDPINAFAEKATVFRNWVEISASEEPGNLGDLRIILADIHASILRLPDGFDDGAIEPEGRSHQEWLTLLKNLQKLPFDHYHEVYDPFSEEDPVVGSLADDLADIYFDLGKGLKILEAGSPIGAAWQWRNQFQFHWGEHLTGAQRAVHWWFARCEDA